MTATSTTSGSNAGTLTSDQLNSIASQSGFSGGSFSNTGLSQSKTVSDTSLGLPPPSQTSDASKINNQMSGSTTGTVFPPPPSAPTNGVSQNTSVSNPIPTAQDIISQGNAQTPGEKTNQGLLEKVAALIGQKKSQQGLTNTAEASAGVPQLTKTVNDLNTQLEGLNNQATDLQNQARPGGAIENKEQQGVLGRGVTAAGLAPQTAGDLRKNQIQQSAIASQSLTLKSAIYGAQGQLSLAKDAADKAATAQYEDQQNQIDYQNALIAANLPQMTKEEKNQALLVQTQLADRQTQIDNAKQDKQTIIALATAALKNNPNDPAAQYAAQQALALSNQQQPDLAQAMGLLGKYQSDPVATQTAYYQMISARNAANASSPVSPNDPNATAALDPGSQSILAQTGLSVAGFNFLTQGTAALSRLSSADRQKIMGEAQNFLNKNGIDISTFQSQYKAYNDVLQKNVERANNTQIFAGEISGTVDQFVNDIGTGFSQLKGVNIADLLAGKQVNNATAQKYAFDLQTMQNDLAGYYAASRGASQPELQDLNAAAGVIQNGINSGSAKAFQQAINTNETKVTNVVNQGVTSAQKQVWNLFGVADKFNPKTSSSASSSDFASSPPNYTVDLAAAKAAIAAGADPAQVKARMLTKYKQVDL